VSDLIVSVHIPKTGGVTFREVLGELAAGRMVQDYADRPLAPRGRWRALRERFRRPELPEGTRVVHGHFVAAKYWRVHPEARFVTWFRDPVERLISHYHYWRREPDPENPLCRRLLEERLSLLAFAALPELRDVHVRFLGGVPPERFAFVGLTERFEEGMALFQRLFCPELRYESARRNANPARSGERYEIEPAERDAIAALNRADLALHARARARYEELRAAAGAR
jgi:hypothetical protein